MKEKFKNYMLAYSKIENDEDIETVEEIVGYYLTVYGIEALSIWTYNLKHAKYKWITDTAVTKILNELFEE